MCDFRRAFAQLPPMHREALILVGVHGLDYDAAAKICGCPAGTMKSRVSRARATLRTLMEGGALTLTRRAVVPAAQMDLSFLFRLPQTLSELPVRR